MSACAIITCLSPGGALYINFRDFSFSSLRICIAASMLSISCSLRISSAASASRLSRSLCSCSATQMSFWLVLLDGCHGLCNRKMSPGILLVLAVALLRSQSSYLTSTRQLFADTQTSFLSQTQLSDSPHTTKQVQQHS